MVALCRSYLVRPIIEGNSGNLKVAIYGKTFYTKHSCTTVICLVIIRIKRTPTFPGLLVTMK